MNIINTNFKDLFLIEHNLFFDDRGSFGIINENEVLNKSVSYEVYFCQDNIVRSNFNVLRGLHFQMPPYSQSKLVTVIDGEILDVAVDIRKESINYGKYFSHILNSDSNLSLFIPKGFAHGYLVRSSHATIHYKVDQLYNKNSEVGIPFNDDFLNIDWGIDKKTAILSEKDKNHPNFDW